MTAKMNNKEKFNIISGLATSLLVLFIGFIFGEKILQTIGVFGFLTTIILWILSYRFMIYIPEQKEKKDKYLWAIKKEKEPSKIKFFLDVHKSSDWENDNLFFLCIHNESYFKDIKHLSVIIAGVNKIESSTSSIALNRSVILYEKLTIPKMKASVDIPFLEIVKKNNRFIIRAIHQETPDKEVFVHEFGYGEYIIQLVIKRKDIGRDSIVIPIYIKYDGWDKISGKVHDMFPKKMFPMSI